MAEQKPGDGVFNIDRIRGLVDLMKEHDLTEVDLQHEEQRIRLTRGSSAPQYVAAPMAMPQALPMATPATSGTAGGGATATADGGAEGDHIVTIKSPMVGTFYARPNPNAKNFVDTGASVQPDTVVCIIEAMKVFNEIPAEVRGKIVAVLVKNEEAVDFGKPLFKVDTRG